MSKSKRKKIFAKINEHNDKMSLLSSADRLNRARSFTVGTAFNGITEVMLRGDGKYLWAILQPVEVVETILQLAANIGCHVQMIPRDDFASWRKWNDSKEQNLKSVGQRSINRPPHSDGPPCAAEISNSDYVAAQLIEKSNHYETVATEKPSKRRRVKRAAAAS